MVYNATLFLLPVYAYIHVMENPAIYEPCPMLLMRMRKQDGSYYCQSCSKTITDFRGKSSEEVRAMFTPDMCGIFDRNQLKPVRYSVRQKWLFPMMVLMAFLGMTVEPLKAQRVKEAPVCPANEASKEWMYKPAKEEPMVKQEPKKKQKRRRRGYRLVLGIIPVRSYRLGCPSF